MTERSAPVPHGERRLYTYHRTSGRARRRSRGRSAASGTSSTTTRGSSRGSSSPASTPRGCRLAARARSRSQSRWPSTSTCRRPTSAPRRPATARRRRVARRARVGHAEGAQRWSTCRAVPASAAHASSYSASVAASAPRSACRIEVGTGHVGGDAAGDEERGDAADLDAPFSGLGWISWLVYMPTSSFKVCTAVASARKLPCRKRRGGAPQTPGRPTRPSPRHRPREARLPEEVEYHITMRLALSAKSARASR